MALLYTLCGLTAILATQKNIVCDNAKNNRVPAADFFDINNFRNADWLPIELSKSPNTLDAEASAQFSSGTPADPALTQQFVAQYLLNYLQVQKDAATASDAMEKPTITTTTTTTTPKPKRNSYRNRNKYNRPVTYKEEEEDYEEYYPKDEPQSAPVMDPPPPTTPPPPPPTTKPPPPPPTTTAKPAPPTSPPSALDIHNAQLLQNALLKDSLEYKIARDSGGKAILLSTVSGNQLATEYGMVSTTLSADGATTLSVDGDTTSSLSPDSTGATSPAGLPLSTITTTSPGDFPANASPGTGDFSTSTTGQGFTLSADNFQGFSINAAAPSAGAGGSTFASQGFSATPPDNSQFNVNLLASASGNFPGNTASYIGATTQNSRFSNAFLGSQSISPSAQNFQVVQPYNNNDTNKESNNIFINKYAALKATTREGETVQTTRSFPTSSSPDYQDFFTSSNFPTSNTNFDTVPTTRNGEYVIIRKDGDSTPTTFPPPTETTLTTSFTTLTTTPMFTIQPKDKTTLKMESMTPGKATTLTPSTPLRNPTTLTASTPKNPTSLTASTPKIPTTLLPTTFNPFPTPDTSSLPDVNPTQFSPYPDSPSPPSNNDPSQINNNYPSNSFYPSAVSTQNDYPIPSNTDQLFRPDPIPVQTNVPNLTNEKPSYGYPSYNQQNSKPSYPGYYQKPQNLYPGPIQTYPSPQNNYPQNGYQNSPPANNYPSGVQNSYQRPQNSYPNVAPTLQDDSFSKPVGAHLVVQSLNEVASPSNLSPPTHVSPNEPLTIPSGAQSDDIQHYPPPSYQNSPPSYQNSPPSYQNSPPSYQNSPPSYQNSPPSYQNSPPEFQNSPPSYQNSPPEFQNTAPSYQNSPPIDSKPPPSYQNSPPSYQNSPPFQQVPPPPPIQNSPPSYQNSPPSYQNSPPSYQNSPPSYQNSPPSYQNSPPSYQNSPPSIQDSPPSIQNSPSEKPTFDTIDANIPSIPLNTVEPAINTPEPGSPLSQADVVPMALPADNCTATFTVRADRQSVLGVKATPGGADCQLTFVSPRPARLALQIQGLQLPKGAAGCDAASVAVYSQRDGRNLLMNKFCGSVEESPVLLAEGSSALVTIKARDGAQRAGFTVVAFLW